MGTEPALVNQHVLGYDSTSGDFGTASGASDGGFQPQQGFWPSSGGCVSLEDPLFGFNGSSLAALPLTGRKI